MVFHQSFWYLAFWGRFTLCLAKVRARSLIDVGRMFRTTTAKFTDLGYRLSRKLILCVTRENVQLLSVGGLGKPRLGGSWVWVEAAHAFAHKRGVSQLDATGHFY